MTMKKAELEKRAGMAIRNEMRQGAAASPFGKGQAVAPDRRSQRERERALGLAPFAVKLPAALIKQLHEEAVRRGVPLADLTADLLRRALA